MSDQCNPAPIGVSPTGRLLWSIPETQYALGIGRTLLYEIVDAGELELVKIGHRSFITAASVHAYIARLSRRNGPVTPMSTDMTVDDADAR